MAEEKAVETKEPERSEAEVQHDAFIEELTKDDKKPEEKKPEEKAPEQELSEKTPEKEPEKKAEEKKPEPPAISAEDKALLAAYDFSDTDANPKLLGALRKAEKDKHGLKTERDRWGQQNADLSTKLKAFAKAESTNIDAVKERIKTRLSKIPKEKLSEHARNLLEDPAYLEAQAAIEVARMTEEEPAAAVDDAKTIPDTAKLREEAEKVFVEVKKAVPDILDLYSKSEFYTWLKAQDPLIQGKYQSYDPKEHVDLAGRYKAFQTAEKAAAAIAAEKDKGSDAFAGHGETGTGRRGPEKELSPEDEFQRIMSMPDAEFKKMDQEVLSGGKRK